jgi:tetratricopeptide (TPR) repeat protein
MKAVKLDPTRTHSLCNLADLYHADGRLTEAENLAQKALRVDPNCIEAWIALGAIAAGRKDVDTAVKFFIKATEIDPANKSAWTNLAEMYKQSGDKKREAQALKMALKSKSTDHPSDFYTMAFKLESLGHKDAARAAMKDGLNMDPSEADVLMNVPYAIEQNQSKSKSQE